MQLDISGYQWGERMYDLQKTSAQMLVTEDENIREYQEKQVKIGAGGEDGGYQQICEIRTGEETPALFEGEVNGYRLQREQS